MNSLNILFKNLMMACLLNLSPDNKRIQLVKMNSTSCTMSLDEVMSKDAGEWKLPIEAGKGAKNEMQEYHHHIAVKIKGNRFTLFYHFKYFTTKFMLKYKFEI